MERINVIKKDTIPEPPFSDTELEILRLNVTNKRDRAIMEFLLSTGCRVSEMVSVNISDIDQIDHSLDVIGKGGKKRTVYIKESAWLHIKLYLESRTDNEPSLFINKRKPTKRISVDAVESMMKAWAKKINLASCHPHRFRTTLCCTLLNKGIDVVTVRDILGHSSVDTTMIYYRYNKKS